MREAMSGWPYEAVEPDPTNDPGERPTACTLDPVDLRRRTAALRDDFRPRVLERSAIADGFVYWFDRSEENLAAITRFVWFESHCCEFLSFGIGLHPGGSRISLRISGPNGAGAFPGPDDDSAAAPDDRCGHCG